jgi:hypothetical protein
MHMTIMIKFKTISIDCAIKEKTHHDTYYDPQKSYSFPSGVIKARI